MLSGSESTITLQWVLHGKHALETRVLVYKQYNRFTVVSTKNKHFTFILTEYIQFNDHEINLETIKSGD